MIDFHCHLDLYRDPAKVIADADEAGIYVLSVTTTPKAWIGTARLSLGRKRIRTALGMHPQVVHERMGELRLFEELSVRTRYIGEIGLDGSSGHGGFAAEQKKAFGLALAISERAGGKILTIHSRRAVDEVLAMLRQYPAAGAPILHWFSGTDRQLREAAAMGCWFSVGPAMLQSEKGRRLAAQMPVDRVLTETDGPFATVKARPLVPEDAWVAVRQLALIWRVDQNALTMRLKQNLRALLAAVPDREERTR